MSKQKDFHLLFLPCRRGTPLEDFCLSNVFSLTIAYNGQPLSKLKLISIKLSSSSYPNLPQLLREETGMSEENLGSQADKILHNKTWENYS